MDFLEPLSDKDLMVKSWGRNRDFYLEYTSGKFPFHTGISSFLSLFFLLKGGKNRNLCPFFGVWYNLS